MRNYDVTLKYDTDDGRQVAIERANASNRKQAIRNAKENLRESHGSSEIWSVRTSGVRRPMVRGFTFGKNPFKF